MADAVQAKTFYTDILRYPQPNSEGQYELEEVLNASENFLPFFDIFGAILKICKNDFEGNITKLRKKCAAIPQATTFRELLQYELDNGLSKKGDSACIAALWYKRGLQFIIAFIEQFLTSKEESGYELFRIAYEATLKKYHSWIVQKGIGMVAKMIPYRKDTVVKLCFGDENLEDKLIEDKRDYLVNLIPVANHLHNLVVDLGIDSEDKV